MLKIITDEFEQAAQCGMDPGVQEHLIERIAATPLSTYPYPHLYAETIFPADYYAALRRNWPDASRLVSIESTGRVTGGRYHERFVMPLSPKKIDALPEEAKGFWSDFAQWMLRSEHFFATIMDKFEPYLRERFGTAMEQVSFSSELLVVRDHTNYKLGPHTDSPRKVLSLLFYCPDDDAYSHLGTSIYTPIDPAFRCAGGPHHPHDKFRRYATMEYRPNTLFAFVKTDRSFHGVEPIPDADVLRDLILYDIHVDADAAQPQQQPGEQPAKPGGALGLTILKNILRRQR